MNECCQSSSLEKSNLNYCPICQQKGKNVPLITLKAMLIPKALETIDSELIYTFCSNSSCEVVYFSNDQTYVSDDLKISVFQKNKALNVPVCYCFGWTRKRLTEATLKNQRPIEHIRMQVQAKRCGCEVNNPQGSCCLGNVTSFIRSINTDKNPTS
ncbi:MULTISPECIES: putative iron-sulfur cluster-binding metallochaperone [Paenibacillus]|uniref:putative iron-sulfur cluster-binding metallochaperone n=1 Tax=Paenibacillus TaxID=44249 RepID=UPI000FD7097E|nr:MULTISPECIES: copper chaperone Copz family protein [Paenibacillus]NTZ19061.1 (2Fe-2S)-binding protein [Paenibacillus sp. JMULE4]